MSGFAQRFAPIYKLSPISEVSGPRVGYECAEAEIFPGYFMFRLSNDEFKNLIFHFGTSGSDRDGENTGWALS